jgi:hypothetical protein
MLRPLHLVPLDANFAVCKLAADAPIPDWAGPGPFLSITRTPDELTVVCFEDAVPPDVHCERGWRCLRVAGIFDFSAVGVLAALVLPLADACLSIFAVSTFGTDYLLVKEKAFERTVAALRQVGHTVA